METLRIFGRGEAETENIRLASQDFRQRTMEVLRMASSLFWRTPNFSPPCRLRWWRFTLASPTSARWTLVTTVRRVTLSAGVPGAGSWPRIFPAASRSRHLLPCQSAGGGAADSLKTFMETPLANPERGEVTLNTNDPGDHWKHRIFLFCRLKAKCALAGPLNFTLPRRATCGAGGYQRLR